MTLTIEEQDLTFKRSEEPVADDADEEDDATTGA